MGPVTPRQEREPTGLAGPSPGAEALCLRLARMLFDFGATADRIRSSVAFLGRRLGCDVDLLITHDALVITVDDGATATTRVEASRRMAGLDLTGLVRVSGVLRGLVPSPFDRDRIDRALVDIRAAPPLHGLPARAVAAACAGAGFCIVNGGDAASALWSAIAATLVFAIRRPLAARGVNVYVAMFAVALVGSLTGGILARVGGTATPEIAVVAPILFLVPGVPLINGGIDVLRNHVTVGLGRAVFGVSLLVALSLGVGLALRIVDVPIGPPTRLAGPPGVLIDCAAAAAAAAALACLNNATTPVMALCAVGGLVARLLRATLVGGGLDPMTAALGGVACSSVLVTITASRLRWPAAFASVMAALPLVPGYFAIVGLHALLAFAARGRVDPGLLFAGLHAVARATFVCVALVAGVVGPVTILERDAERI